MYSLLHPCNHGLCLTATLQDERAGRLAAHACVSDQVSLISRALCDVWHQLLLLRKERKEGNALGMNEWITSIQPPGLMKMRLMHHQEHHLGHQAPQNNP